jgi:Zn-dependent membrane protease YugP
MIWIFALVIGLIIFGPGIWVNHVMASNRDDRSDFPGTGGELARHLLDYHDLSYVSVETTTRGDHYDPERKVVGLTQKNHDERSITAVAVAAHEVGHALQDQEGYGPFNWRQRMVKTAAVTDRIGSVALLGMSMVGSAVVSPRLLILGVVAIILMGTIRVAVHLITLPMELDASFNRALPILVSGRYLPTEDIPAARSVLKAAAYTYVAGSLIQILNLFRFLRYIR